MIRSPIHFEDESPQALSLEEGRYYVVAGRMGYEGFKSELSAKSQASLAERYEQAQRSGQMVVFVRDNEDRRLVSYSIDCE